MENVIALEKVSAKDLSRVGGKNASLGEMLKHLTMAGVKVPRGFAVTVEAYQSFLLDNHLQQKIQQALAGINTHDIKNLQHVSASIREWILKGNFSDEFLRDVKQAYSGLDHGTDMAVAVRSSATAEDLPTASFAGQQETYLNILGIDNVLHAIKKVYASLFSERAISYRIDKQIEQDKIGISVGVQRMVRSDEGCSGVIFTLDTESGFDQVVFINANYGLGETIVQGLVNPDEFYVFKPLLKLGKQAVLRRTLGSKAIKMINADLHANKVKTVPVSIHEQQRFCLSDQEVETLAKYAVIIEEHYKMPMDIEWAKDNSGLYIVQARPETVKSQTKKNVLERFYLENKSAVLATGRSVGQKIGKGSARIIIDAKKMDAFKPGDVLVTDMTDPDWEPIMKLAAAIVTNRGGRTCHAAIIARELGIPAVVGCNTATANIKNGAAVTVSCAAGESGYVYEGLLDFRVEQISITNMPKLPFKLCMNMGNPEKAFSYQFLPNDGVGLARLEFIIGNTIGIHPAALLNFETLPIDLQKQIKPLIAAYASPADFYVKKLAEGIATIAAAFYPKEVIFRFSDFKSNEYANLLGGKLYEPNEENPMIGFRGASRYVAESFRPCFELECKAFKLVREQMGLVNAQVMVPFVRTVDELKNVIKVIDDFGLKRGENQLKIYMMCEVPSNAILAEDFLEHVDGFSIGSNDLTQLTLGLDRDSSLVASLFDERNAAVKVLLERAIKACNKAGKYIGICGQAPSDHPDLAKWLADQGIQSISLTPDSIVETWMFLGKR
jgi:pyruvate,water dikinase